MCVPLSPPGVWGVPQMFLEVLGGSGGPQQDLGKDGEESHWVLRVPLRPPCLGGALGVPRWLLGSRGGPWCHSVPRPQQDFGDKGDDGPRRLLGVQLREHVTRVAPPRCPRLLRHEPKNPGGGGAVGGRGRGQSQIWVSPSLPRFPFWGSLHVPGRAPIGVRPPGGVTGVGRVWRVGGPPFAPPVRPPPSPAVLGVGAAVGDAADGVMPAEKESGGAGMG